jgi:hypothetical protein
LPLDLFEAVDVAFDQAGERGGERAHPLGGCDRFGAASENGPEFFGVAVGGVSGCLQIQPVTCRTDGGLFTEARSGVLRCRSTKARTTP